MSFCFVFLIKIFNRISVIFFFYIDLIYILDLSVDTHNSHHKCPGNIKKQKQQQTNTKTHLSDNTRNIWNICFDDNHTIQMSHITLKLQSTDYRSSLVSDLTIINFVYSGHLCVN